MASHNPPQAFPRVEGITPLVTPASVERTLATRHGSIKLDQRTVIMGVLNLTPDSFYDGGRRGEVGQGVRDGVVMAEAGAEIIDIGGESTRPGSRRISAQEELARVLPVLRALRREITVPISIDTYKSHVAQAALDAGADIVNDISALRFDAEMISVVSREQVPVVLMHMQGTPRTMQTEPHYRDVVAEVKDFLLARMQEAVDHGVSRAALVVDPGIGFGKTLEHNLALLRGLPELAALGAALLVGASRKAFIGKLLGLDAGERLEGSLAAAVAAIFRGANILRVHDVRETVRAARVADAIRYGRGVF